MLPLIPLALSLVPDLVKAVAGDTAGKVAQAAASAVAAVTGTDDPSEAQRRVEQDPALAAQVRIRLAEIAAEQARAERQADLDEMKAFLVDVGSARTQQVALTQAGSGVQWAPVVVSVIVLGAFSALGLALLLKAVPPENKEAALLMLGQVSTFAGAAVAFWLGSSAGSKQKTDALAAAAKGGA